MPNFRVQFISMAIGSGQSKPVIRVLGFDRLAVVEDGIKHEGQQGATTNDWR